MVIKVQDQELKWKLLALILGDQEEHNVALYIFLKILVKFQRKV